MSKASITRESYLEAVRVSRNTSDTVVARRLGVDRTTVFRFRKANPAIFAEAEKLLADAEKITFTHRNVGRDVFMNIAIIQRWIDAQNQRIVKPRTIASRIQKLYNVCIHLKVNPEKLTIDMAADLVNEVKQLYYKDLKAPVGLSYLAIRKPIRNFFMLAHGVSGEMLGAKGIDAGRSKGTGSLARQRVTADQRLRFDKYYLGAVDDVLREPRFSSRDIDRELMSYEIDGISKFMYYTATRIGVTNLGETGTLSVTCNNPKHVFDAETFSFNLHDKGKNKGIEWDKMVMDDGRKRMEQYFEQRFNVPEGESYKLLSINSYLFPLCTKYPKVETAIMKLTLQRAGAEAGHPNHIWRHTFAQDMLHATDWNYELTAAIGGWKDTGTLKLSYGQMSDDAKVRGLRKAMGLPVEDVTYELKW